MKNNKELKYVSIKYCRVSKQSPKSVSHADDHMSLPKVYVINLHLLQFFSTLAEFLFVEITKGR